MTIQLFSRELASHPEYQLARDILGRHDFITPNELWEASGIIYPTEYLVTLCQTIPDRATLEKFAPEDITLIPGPPTALSLIDVCNSFGDYFPRRFLDDDAWFDAEPEAFAQNDKVSPGWIALYKNPLEDSLDEPWANQLSLLDPRLIVPNIAQIVWAMSVYHAVREHYLFKETYVRTTSCDSEDDRVFVGHFNIKGLVIDSKDEDETLHNLGIAAAWKL